MKMNPGIIGDEKRLVDILAGEDVIPLLASAVAGGVGEAAILDEHGAILWQQGTRDETEHASCSLPIKLEGEEIGQLRLSRGNEDALPLETLAALLQHSIKTILFCKLKRIFTNQLHSKVVNLSYEQLMENNRKLALWRKNTGIYRKRWKKRSKKGQRN